MPISDARKRANKKWNDMHLKERYDEIKVRVSKGKKEIIQAEASKHGESLNAYINRAIDSLMSNGGSCGNSEAETEDNYTSR